MKKIHITFIIISIIIIIFVLYIFIEGYFLSTSEEEDDKENDDEIYHQNPCWSPDGTQILFSSTEDSDSMNIWIMNNDSSNARPLLFGGNVDNDADYVHLPGSAWCAATNQICFSTDRENNDEIWYVESNRATLVRVTNHPSKDWEPSWSPNGEWIVFQSDRNGNWDLFKIRKDGTDLEQLTNNPADDWQPSWSPDGEHILFQSERSGNWQLYSVDNTSIESNLQDLSGNPLYEDTDASWNPDGDWIVFSSDRSGNDADICIMRKDGSDKFQITNYEQYDGAPAFASDNNTIAFESLRSGEMRIWTIEIISRKLIQITF